MASYPTCTRCYGTESELDVGGVCISCSHWLSAKESLVGSGGSTVPPRSQTRANERGSPSASIRFFENPTPTGDQFAPSLQKTSLPAHVKFTNYHDLKYLDRGGMGVIYTAVQSNANRVVALKMMNLIAQSDTRQERRFKTEAEALARLSHPGIVQIYDVGQENGVSYFSMEYVPGGTLAKRLKTGPKFSHKQATELTASIASALAAAHAVGITHRDIKPSNILLSEMGRPKLTDFGLAAFSDRNSRMTNTGAMIGTPAYMSPEQAASNNREVGPASDLYSLGATLYEMLTGRPPFMGEAPMHTAMKVIKEPIVPPRHFDPSIPVDLESICLTCLEKDPRDRYQTAASLANDLSRSLRGEPIGRGSKVIKVRKLFRKHRNAVAMACLVIAAVAAGMAIRPFAKIPDSNVAMLKADQDHVNSLRKGISVELMAVTGLPKYYKWERGEGKISERIKEGYGDRAAVIDSEKRSHLELCSDTISDHFMIEIDLQHIRLIKETGRVGIYIKSRDASSVARYTSLTLTDFGDAKLNQIDENSSLLFQTHEYFPTPSEDNSQTCIINSATFSHDFSRPRPWKSLRFRVRGNLYEGELLGLNSGMNNATDRITLAVTENRMIEIDNMARMSARLKFPDFANTIPNCPTWSSVGIFVEQGEMAFRNVKLTPLAPNSK